MKLFGKELFNFKRKGEEYLWDFARFGLIKSYSDFMDLAVKVAVQPENATTASTKKVEAKKEKLHLAAKGIYETGALNDNQFSIKVDPTYLQGQINLANEKLGLFPAPKKIKRNSREGGPFEFDEMGGVKHGRDEVRSIIERLENRKKLSLVKKVVEKYPHTTSALINRVLKENPHLRYEKVDAFIPDLRKVAVDAMKEYDGMCLKLCDKKAVFYILANKEDFERKAERRDPILLAESPFGFFWQILGAWDEEMVYLGDL